MGFMKVIYDDKFVEMCESDNFFFDGIKKRYIKYFFYSFLSSLVLTVFAPSVSVSEYFPKFFIGIFSFFFFFEIIGLFGRWKYKIDFTHSYKENLERLRKEGVIDFEEVKIDEGGSVKGLDYWFDLFEKGAISKEEYEGKKRELL